MFSYPGYDLCPERRPRDSILTSISSHVYNFGYRINIYIQGGKKIEMHHLLSGPVFIYSCCGGCRRAFLSWPLNVYIHMLCYWHIWIRHLYFLRTVSCSVLDREDQTQIDFTLVSPCAKLGENKVYA